mmetsp:Transcript_24348/g.96545  ORF Transcript_24348/g.96545 Transcript_24348/m.96545 type:complete len:219 (+) Transcript_24348:387-1043(+)
MGSSRVASRAEPSPSCRVVSLVRCWCGRDGACSEDDLAGGSHDARVVVSTTRPRSSSAGGPLPCARLLPRGGVRPSLVSRRPTARPRLQCSRFGPPARSSSSSSSWRRMAGAWMSALSMPMCSAEAERTSLGAGLSAPTWGWGGGGGARRLEADATRGRVGAAPTTPSVLTTVTSPPGGAPPVEMTTPCMGAGVGTTPTPPVVVVVVVVGGGPPGFSL